MRRLFVSLFVLVNVCVAGAQTGTFDPFSQRATLQILRHLLGRATATTTVLPPISTAFTS